MEEVLSERIAACSWRLNRVVLYETELIAAAQEGVIETVREERKRKLEHERILAQEGEEVLTDLGILVEAHPENALDDVRRARKLYKTVHALSDSPPDTPIEGAEGAYILELAAEYAVRMAAYQSGQELDHEAVRLLSDSL